MITSQNKLVSKIFPIIFLLLSIIFYIFIFNINFSKTTKLPIGGSGFFLLIISLSVSTSILMILFSKKISLDENYINIKFIILQKIYNYNYKEIVGWREIISIDKFGEYKAFYIQTLNKKIFMFGSREFKNYNEIVSKIISKSPEIEISRFYNFHLLLKTFVITYLILDFQT